MAVKYVKDFSFPASGGFHGDVQRFAKGGHVTKVPAKAKASAKDMPARAKPNAPARGAPKMKSEPAKGKRQGYNEGGRVPGYDMDRLPAKKPPGRTMDLAPSKPFKGAYEGYADGGEIYVAPGPAPYDEVRVIQETLQRPDDDEIGIAEDPTYEERMQRLRLQGSDTWPGSTRESIMPTGEDVGIPQALDLTPEERDRLRIRGDSAYRAADLQDRGIMPQPSPLARAARMAARREMMGDRGEMGRRFARRTVMPTEITGRMPAPYMPTYTAPTREESDAYLKAAGIVPSIEARFAKGGKVQKVMREYKEGKLHSGSKKGPLVKNREQAVAIALSEARKAGAKIPKKGEGGIFNDESMAYQSKGPKTRYTPAKRRREARERDMDRRALDKARHAERFAPGLSLDMRAKGGMMKGKKFPDLTGDGKVTRADVLKGRGVIKDRKMPTHNRKPMYGKG